jgi:8-oxo-dGTP diphosphatase
LPEETGIESVELDAAAVVEFDFRSPSRKKYVAVYRTVLRVVPRLVVNDEAAVFLWWDPRSPLVDGMSPLDAEIGRRVLGAG